MLEVTYGQTYEQMLRPEITRMLADTLRDNQTGSLYLGHPLLQLSDKRLAVDALLVSESNGLVAFLISDDIEHDDLNGWKEVQDRQDEVYVALERSLIRHNTLRKRRGLLVDINVITMFPSDPTPPLNGQIDIEPNTLTSITNVESTVGRLAPIKSELRPHIESALQAVTTIKPRERRKAAIDKPGSYGDALNKIEQEISKLDRWQKRAAIEFPNAPQRIRGLAGSGKTIVLALKAVYLHAQNPDWTIAVTFHTRSLYQQFEDLIRRFSFEYINDEPDWSRLRILHAWGGSGRSGIYAEIAESVKAPVRDFLYGKTKFGSEYAFAGICSELLNIVSGADCPPLYDAILIDEAQDLPPEFFQLVYLFAEQRKRIVWAYDELQRLSESSMPQTDEIFGLNDAGEPMVQLHNPKGEPRQDITLRRCYRNPSESLTLAHALGLGIYRKGGQVQGFNDPIIWNEIGYDLLKGELVPGSQVRLQRQSVAHAGFFKELLKSDEIIRSKAFKNAQQEAAGVARSVERNIKEDLLRPDDILIVLSNSYTAKSDAVLFSQALQRHGIQSQLAGFHFSEDKIFINDFVTMANIYRSKGNEAAMVYIVGAQYYMHSTEQIKRRNALFTAITRSRAWVRISGYGPLFDELITEVDQIMKNKYALNFTLPTPDDLTHMHKINRDLNVNEKMAHQRMESSAREFIDALDQGEIAWDTLSPDIRHNFRRIIRRESIRSEDI